MGLCKCPKRRVTNQFCFEHRVNVCEHCLVTNHPKCIVQSYLQWLQDSDYNPICEICTKDLESEDCIRLTCYHVYHWWCLNDWARSLPADLAPAGYTCPSCRSPLFPPSNLVSPVADVLREKLSGVNWARTGLGLPLLSDEVYQPVRANNSNSSEIRSGVLDEKTTQQPDHSVLHIPAPTSHPFARSSESSHHESAAYAALPRRAPHESELRSNVVFDRDEDKYKRERFRNWMLWKRKTLFSPSRGRHQLRFLLVLLVIVGLVFILFRKFGSDNDEYDANFDVRKNPQIHIQENKISIEHES